VLRGLDACEPSDAGLNIMELSELLLFLLKELTPLPVLAAGVGICVLMWRGTSGAGSGLTGL
jgi:hypothetical protein